MSYQVEWEKEYHEQMNEERFAKLKTQATAARAAILKMTTLAGSGHPGGSMSTLDFLLNLYTLIDHAPDGRYGDQRDKVIISHGHVSPAAYSTLALNDYFDMNQMISQFRLAGSIYEGHVEPVVPGIEWATGNLGQGLSAACGFALAAKVKKQNCHVYVLMGDGEQQKGQLSEARRFAVKHQLNNLTAFIDYNKLQISGKCEDVMFQNIKAEYEAGGWEVIEIDGHSSRQITAAVMYSKTSKKPSLILAHTIMGKGVSFMENDEKWHGQALPYTAENGHDLVHALQELGVEDDLETLKKLRNEFKPGRCSLVENKEERYQYITGSHINYEKVTDNRSAWGNALLDLAKLNNSNEYLPFAVFDCDLSGSVKTKGFAQAFPDNFFQSGIMEHHAAVCAGALSKNGFQTFFSDFGVFGIDETYNQHRLNDINETNLKIVLTHVGIDVGEDGKSHQCIDYLGQVRNMYHFKCLIPADPNQTDHIIRWLINEPGNCLVAMGRSKLDIIKKTDGSIYYDDEYQFEFGKCDLLRSGNDAAMFVMGTLTSQAVKIADTLREQNINLQLWNVSTPQQIPDDVLQQAAATGYIFTYEDHNVQTGLGACVMQKIVQQRVSPAFKAFGVENYPVSGKSSDVYRYCYLDQETVIDGIKSLMQEN